MLRRLVVPLLLLLAASVATARAQDTTRYTRADTLRGSITPERAWWDVTFYDLHVRISPEDSTISGWNRIVYRAVKPGRRMQIDLMAPLVVDSIVQDARRVEFSRDGDVVLATLHETQLAGRTHSVTVYYHGRPRVAQQPPWDGGFVWARDALGRPWAATAVQGFGASAWWPNKDTQAEEPDSQRIAVTVPAGMMDVSNGRLRSEQRNPDGTTTYEWFVSSPINNYNVAVNAGAYGHFGGEYGGERGPLTLDFYPLANHVEQAKRQFAQVPSVLKCFEGWFGPYPWYEDGYKLVETPYLGMEHQSAVAYGNQYANGYLGQDLSRTGLGLKWDYIIVHESAHEWWGNSITTRDIADMWVHEAFANYAESLYVECLEGEAAGASYVRGSRVNIRNDRPIVGPYGVNAEGSRDMYFKGANLLHTIRQVIDDDARWRGILRGLNDTFRHRIVTGEQVQRYMSARAGVDLSKIFRQYLYTTWIPVLEYRIDGSVLHYRWAHVVPGFDMPVRVTLGPDGYGWIRPTTAWKSRRIDVADPGAFRVDEDFLVEARPAAGR